MGKKAQRIQELEKRIETLEDKVIRERLEHRISVLEAQWENRDT